MVVVFGVVSLLDCGTLAEAKLPLLSICHHFFITVFADGLAIFLEQQPHRRGHHSSNAFSRFSLSTLCFLFRVQELGSGGDG